MIVAGRRGSAGGFTLVEVLIVIAVLGVLAGIVVFAVGSARGDGEDAACRHDRRAIETALEAYRAQHATYPPALTDLTGSGGLLRSDPSITASTKAGPGYALTYDGAGSLSCVTLAGAPQPPSPPAGPQPPSPPAAPQSVAANLNNGGVVHATWTSVAGLTYECVVTASATVPHTGASPCTTPYNANGQSGKTDFWVRAVDAGQAGAWAHTAL